MKKNLSTLLQIFLVFCLSFFLLSCSSMPSSGPSSKDIKKNTQNTKIEIIKVNNVIAKKLAPFSHKGLFSRLFPKAKYSSKVIESGDSVEVRLWEAPPAVLFGGGLAGAAIGAATAGEITLPEQMVGDSGEIDVPFAGVVPVLGKTTQEAGREIVEHLSGKAHKPQALVKLVQNKTSDVVVVGDVSNSTRMPLTPQREKLLDALAAAGGTKHPIDKISLQLTRGNSVHSLPLETIINDPRQNIALQADDVVTALHQSLSFTALGATGKNAEIDFEAKGITLAQALARVGGLIDSRSDAKGVFIFRFEPVYILRHVAPQLAINSSKDPTVPVIYQVDLGKPESFFAAQKMPIKDKDLLYIAEAPSVELKKFIDMVFSGIYPTLSVINATK